MYLLKDFDVYDRPGYFGKKRPEKESEYNQKFPQGWKECWQVGDLVYTFYEAVMLYEEAYFNWLWTRDEPYIQWLLSFSECYDNDVRNIEDGVFYDVRAPVRHLQDVAVRRCFLRRGIYFRGTDPKNLLHIRGPESNGFALNPGRVPFHNFTLILPEKDGGPIPKWADPHSVEAFWQRNKVIGKPLCARISLFQEVLR